jgi:hypothetical protein
MFCPQCGTQNADDSLRCTNCGAALRSAAAANLQAIGESSAFQGLVVLFVSFFTMPLRTLKIMARMLREVGERGALDTESSSVPHLTWIQTAGTVLVVVAMFGAGLSCLVAGIAGGGAAFVPMLLAAPLAMIAVNWVGMAAIETLGLSVDVANNIKKLASR